MSKRTRIELRIESLETLALMSNLPGLPGLATGATGLGNISSLTATDAQALQQDSSGGAVEVFISQIEVTYGRRANVKQFAAAVIADHTITNYDLQNVASQVGVTLPPGIALPSDSQVATKVLAAVRSGNVDAAYLKAMTQINAQDVANDTNLTQTTQNPAVSLYAQETGAYDQNHLNGATTLNGRNKRATYNPTIATTTITGSTGQGTQGTVSASDTSALQQDGSGGALELFISQIEEQKGQRSAVTQYAQTVVADHQVTNYDLLATGVGTSVTIPPGITSASDIADAKRVLAASRGNSLDSVYLQVMQSINSTDVANDQQLVASTSNARVKAYAQETLTFDQTHLTGAQTLRANPRATTYTPTVG